MSLTKATNIMIQGAPVNVLDYGADPTGATDSTAAIQAALNLGGEILFPRGTYLVDYLTTPVTVTVRGESNLLSIIKRKDNSTINKDLFVNTADVRVEIYNLQFDGNKANNTGTPANYQSGIALAAGSGVIEGCYLKDFNNNAIITGGEDRYFTTNTAEAYDIQIRNNKIDQGTDTAKGLGDCIRPVRTRNLLIHGNVCLNGFSSIRTNYYNKNAIISDNYCYGAVSDVGITAGIGSDYTIINNQCIGALGQHGIEIAGTQRVTCIGNICKDNARDGILLDIYGPPVGANYAGYVDDVAFITNPTTLSPTDCIVSNNILLGNSGYGLREISGLRCVYTDNIFRANILGSAVLEASQYPTVSNNVFLTGGLQWSSYQFNATAFGNRFVEAQNLTRLPAYGAPVNVTERTNNISAWSAVANGSLIRDQGNTVYFIDNAVNGSVYANSIDITGVKGTFILETEYRSDIDASTFGLSVELYLGGVFVATIINNTGSALSSSYTKFAINSDTSAYAVDSAFDSIRVTYTALAGQTNDVYVKYLNIY